MDNCSFVGEINHILSALQLKIVSFTVWNHADCKKTSQIIWNVSGEVCSHHYRAHSICSPVENCKAVRRMDIFPQSEDPLIKHGCVAHFLLLKSKYSVQVCSSHWEQLNEFESAVLLHSALLVGLLDNDRKNGISVGCVLWIWLHIPVVLLSISVSFCFAFLWFWHVCILSACLWHVVCWACKCKQTREDSSITSREWGNHLSVLFHSGHGPLSGTHGRRAP